MSAGTGATAPPPMNPLIAAFAAGAGEVFVVVAVVVGVTVRFTVSGPQADTIAEERRRVAIPMPIFLARLLGFPVLAGGGVIIRTHSRQNM